MYSKPLPPAQFSVLLTRHHNCGFASVHCLPGGDVDLQDFLNGYVKCLTEYLSPSQCVLQPAGDDDQLLVDVNLGPGTDTADEALFILCTTSQNQ